MASRVLDALTLMALCLTSYIHQDVHRIRRCPDKPARCHRQCMSILSLFITLLPLLQGSGTIKAGFAGQDHPKCFFPSLYVSVLSVHIPLKMTRCNQRWTSKAHARYGWGSRGWYFYRTTCSRISWTSQNQIPHGTRHCHRLGRHGTYLELDLCWRAWNLKWRGAFPSCNFSVRYHLTDPSIPFFWRKLLSTLGATGMSLLKYCSIPSMYQLFSLLCRLSCRCPCQKLGSRKISPSSLVDMHLGGQLALFSIQAMVSPMPSRCLKDSRCRTLFDALMSLEGKPVRLLRLFYPYSRQ